MDASVVRAVVYGSDVLVAIAMHFPWHARAVTQGRVVLLAIHPLVHRRQAAATRQAYVRALALGDASDAFHAVGDVNADGMVPVLSHSLPTICSSPLCMRGSYTGQRYDDDGSAGPRSDRVDIIPTFRFHVAILGGIAVRGADTREVGDPQAGRSIAAEAR